MKIFEFKWGDRGPTEWVQAPGHWEAKAFYLRYNGCGSLEGCKVTEVPKQKWNRMYILDLNDCEPDADDLEYSLHYPDGHNEHDYCNGYRIECSFAEYVKNNPEIDMIATTEY